MVGFLSSDPQGSPANSWSPPSCPQKKALGWLRHPEMTAARGKHGSSSRTSVRDPAARTLTLFPLHCLCHSGLLKCQRRNFWCFRVRALGIRQHGNRGKRMQIVREPGLPGPSGTAEWPAAGPERAPCLCFFITQLRSDLLVSTAPLRIGAASQIGARSSS